MGTKADAGTRQALRAALAAAEAKKALEPVVLDVRGLAGFTDYFLLCHGANPRQVQAIADEIERALAKRRPPRRPSHREGYAHAEWVVLDYLDFVVHVQSAAGRAFYALERLWQKAPHWRPEPRPRRAAGAARPATKRRRAGAKRTE